MGGATFYSELVTLRLETTDSQMGRPSWPGGSNNLQAVPSWHSPVLIRYLSVTEAGTSVRAGAHVPSGLPGGVLQGSGEGGIVISGVLQGIVPCCSRQDPGIRVLTAQRILQRLVKGCFATGPALTFLKLLKKKKFKKREREKKENALSDSESLESVSCKACSRNFSLGQGVKHRHVGARPPGFKSQL